jgi:hypothetical protein
MVAFDKIKTHYEASSHAYTTWGNVETEICAQRISNESFVFVNKWQNEQIVHIQEGIRSTDFTVVLLSNVFKKRKRIQVILINKQFYAGQMKHGLKTILEDQCQLLGLSQRYANVDQNDFYSSVKNVLTALNNRFAAFLSDGRSIVLNFNYDDAYAASQVLEKTCKAYIESKVLGKAFTINVFESWIMHKFYLLKYSKQSEKNK